MEILKKTSTLTGEVEVFYFEHGSPSNNTTIDVFNFKVFSKSHKDYHLTCHSAEDLSLDQRKVIALKILYFIRCRDSGSREFVLCTNTTTRKEIWLEYINGLFSRQLSKVYIEVIVEGKPVRFLTLEQKRFQMIGYTFNKGANDEVLTRDIFVDLIKDDLIKRVSKQLTSLPKPIRKFQPPEIYFEHAVICRYHNILALSDYLVHELDLKTDSYVLLRQVETELLLAFLNLDNEVAEIHHKVNQTKFARIEGLNSNHYPLVVYLRSNSSLDMKEIMIESKEYCLDLEGELYEGNIWFRLMSASN